MTLKRFWRIVSLDEFRFRQIEVEDASPIWQIDHFFLSHDDLPYWLKGKPPLDTGKLKFTFKEKPKSKKIPDFTEESGQLIMKAAIYEQIFYALIGPYVTLFPLKISNESYYFLRPDVEIDCVDEDRSVLRQHDDGYRYKWPLLILKDVPESAPPIFRPGVGREFWRYPVFSDEFVALCKENTVICPKFEEVYPAIEAL